MCVCCQVPGLSSKLMTVEQSIVARYDVLRGLVKTLDSVKVANPPLPQPIANKPLPPDTKYLRQAMQTS